MTTPRVTVPVEPTPEMVKAGVRCAQNNHASFVRDAYRAMLTAAPVREEGGAVMAPISREQVVAIVRQFASPSWCSVDRLVDTLFTALAAREEAPAEAGEREALFRALRSYKLTNMACEDDPSIGYPLVDLMSNDGTDISTGEEEMRVLADHLSEALRTQPPAREEAQPVAWPENDPVYVSAMRVLKGTTGWDQRARDLTARLIAKNTRPAPDALRLAVEALEPFNRAYQAHLAAYANFMPSGATEAEQRFVEGERKDQAEEAAFEVLSKITLEQLCAVNEALAALQAEQGAK